jgi:hypothetical protein
MVNRSIPVGRKVAFSGLVVVAVLLLAEGASRLILRYTALGPRINSEPLFTVQETFDLPGRPPPELRLRDDLWIRQPEPEDSDRGQMITTLPEGPLAVLVGGSSPHGSGLEYDDTFWAILERDRVGGMTYVNAAMVGYRVDGAVAQLHWTLELGDVKLAAIYAGDNEWGGWVYPKVKQPKTVHKADDLFMASAAYRLAATSMRYGLTLAPPKEITDLKRADPMTLDDICLNEYYTNHDYFSAEQVGELRQRLLDNFRDWLVLAVTTSAEIDGTTTLLLTNPIRYRLSPCHHIPQFISEKYAHTRREGKILRLLRQAVALLMEGDATTAKPLLLEAWDLDPDSTLTNHYLAWTYEAEGDIESARRHFLRSRNTKVGGAGMMGDLNDIIRQVAADHETAVLVDLQGAFDAYADRHGLGLGDQLFQDWCHPSVEGAQVIADTLRPVIESVAANTG